MYHFKDIIQNDPTVLQWWGFLCYFALLSQKMFTFLIICSWFFSGLLNIMILFIDES